MREETGLRVAVGGLVAVDSTRFQLDDRDLHGLRVIYRVQIVGGNLTHEIEGSTEHCAWWTREEALKLPLVKLARLGIELGLG